MPKRRIPTTPIADTYLIMGEKRICQAMDGISTYSLRRWARYYGFPLCKLPSKNVATTKGLIDAWVIARAEASERTRSPHQLETMADKAGEPA